MCVSQDPTQISPFLGDFRMTHSISDEHVLAPASSEASDKPCEKPPIRLWTGAGGSFHSGSWSGRRILNVWPWEAHNEQLKTHSV